ncbi:alpha/beta hydrolase [Flavobacterium sp. KACC 22763]|uniref:alpha/beta hydrolase n=1 Tax=Flavobacterium sp. KACC 22763 TaxID=3025668 RepID=UPI0023651644|nr:alpha/beta hydrolase [Flavobacterium sp. KACC 22763]WDF63972.1 alpha/beta hydrolase [Flavobacterium sp. KACC 22763]
MKKPRLLLLSDLFGGNPEWIQNYIEILEIKFDVQYYDVLKLAQIDSSSDEKEIHNQFLNGGIEKAVNKLLDFEREDAAVLGFSIGGTIAWKACLRSLKVTELVAVSSTRLRFENEVPNCKIKLYFGEKDSNIPKYKWFSELRISNLIFENQDHLLYQEKENAFLICSNFL